MIVHAFSKHDVPPSVTMKCRCIYIVAWRTCIRLISIHAKRQLHSCAFCTVSASTKPPIVVHLLLPLLPVQQLLMLIVH
jgi:hypothetical protein